MISEADAEDYRQQAGEEAWQAFLERSATMGGPEAPEPCEHCWGKGRCAVLAQVGEHRAIYNECPRCLGTGVQP